MVLLTLYRINIKETNEFFLGITENRIPKHAQILFQSRYREEFDDYCRIIHKNTQNDPKRVWTLPNAKNKRIQPLEVRRKISEYRKGRLWDDNTKQAIAKTLKASYKSGKRQPARPNKGQRFSKEHRAKMKAAALARPKKVCPHCGTLCAINNYTMWHGDNCRSNW